MHEKVAFQPDSRVRQSPGVTCLVRGMLSTAREHSRARRGVADPIPGVDRSFPAPWEQNLVRPPEPGVQRFHAIRYWGEHERYRSLTELAANRSRRGIKNQRAVDLLNRDTLWGVLGGPVSGSTRVNWQHGAMLTSVQGGSYTYKGPVPTRRG